MTEQEDLEQIYGPLARHSDHKRGNPIRYCLAGEPGEYAGTIIWVCAPGMLGSQEVGLRYIVTRNGATSFPDVVSPADVLV
jgi:hypothetical protein